jgi:hypothetical protein
MRMSTQALMSGKAPMPTTRLLAVVGLSLALGYLVVLGSAVFTGHWLFDAEGRPIASDFVNV